MNSARSVLVHPAHSALEAYLHAIPLFAQVESGEMLDLLRLIRPVTLTKGEVLFREGTPGKAMWLLGEGAEVAVSATPPGTFRAVPVAEAHAGEVVGEMALIDEGARSGTAVVVREGPAHVIDALEFQTLREAKNPLAYKVLRQLCMQLCHRLRATSDRIVPASPDAPLDAPDLPLGPPASVEEVDAFEPFSSLPEIVKLALSQKLRVVRTTSVQPVFGEGEHGDAAFFILEGEVTVGRNGQTLARMGPGHMFGIIAVIDDGPRAASCVTSGPATLLRLSNPDFDALFAQGNRFAYQLVDSVARQLVGHLRAANKLLVLLPPRGESQRGSFTPAPAELTPTSIERALANEYHLPLELELEVA